MSPGHEESWPGAIVMLVTSPLTEDSHTTKAVDATRHFTWQSPGDTLLGKHWSSRDVCCLLPTTTLIQGRMNAKKRMLVLLSCLFLLLMAKVYFRNHQKEELPLSDWFNPRRRMDVITTTDWLALVIWEGTFDREALEKYYRKQNTTVGLAVFAVGSLTDQYLDPFLQSASKFFMPGYRVIFYVMVDRHLQLPETDYNPLQTFQIHVIGEERWWSNFDLMRMKILAEHIQEHIKYEVDFLFIMSTNLVFQNEFGVETLSTSVAQLHAWWYFWKTKDLPYERRPTSAAYIPFGLGDFYYAGTIIGGVPFQVLDFTQEYLKGVVWDAENGLNSTYEKYLNKYFFLNKPTKLLSPEYSWDPTFHVPKQVWYMKIAQYPTDSL